MMLCGLSTAPGPEAPARCNTVTRSPGRQKRCMNWCPPLPRDIASPSIRTRSCNLAASSPLQNHLLSCGCRRCQPCAWAPTHISPGNGLLWALLASCCCTNLSRCKGPKLGERFGTYFFLQRIGVMSKQKKCRLSLCLSLLHQFNMVPALLCPQQGMTE